MGSSARLATMLFVVIATAANGVAKSGHHSEVLQVRLMGENGSDETGTAMLSSSGDYTRVVISVRGEPAGASQPAGMYLGVCGGVERIKYDLHDVRKGRSTSIVFLPFDRFRSAHLIVDIQDSVKSLHAAKDARDVSCGAFERALTRATCLRRQNDGARSTWRFESNGPSVLP